jgi:integrase
MKAMTRAYTLSRLRHHVLPLLGRKRISEIRPKVVEQLARDVTAGKTAKDEKTGARKRIIVRGGEGAARKVVRDLSAVFTFAQRQELCGANPCEAAAVNKTDNQRRNFLTLEQVRDLGKALEDLEVKGVNPKALNIARLWAMTGFRRNEAAGLKRSEVNWERACVVFGDSKTGFSVRPLGAPALALLASIPREDWQARGLRPCGPRRVVLAAEKWRKGAHVCFGLSVALFLASSPGLAWAFAAAL